MAGGLRPRFGRLTAYEGEAALLGLVAVDEAQLRAGGLPWPSPALHYGIVRYNRWDPHEEWQPWAQVVARGSGDCEDLACAVVAERRILFGHDVVPKVIPSPSGGPWWHVVVEDRTSGELLDPSVTGGMKSSKA